MQNNEQLTLSRSIRMVFAILVVSFFLFFGNTKSALAQGTFDCTHTGSNCIPTNVNCDFNYASNPDECSHYIGNPGACESQTGITCIFSSNPSSNSGTGRLYNPAVSPFLQSLTGVGFVQRLLPALISALLILGVIVFMFVFLTGAVKWIMSGGDKAAIEGAKSKLTNGLIGLVIMFSFFAIVSAIEYFFSINILQLDLSSLFLT